MLTYEYLSIDTLYFIQLSRLPGTLPDSFIADDEEGRTWKKIRRDGFKLLMIHGDRSIFEKTYGRTVTEP